MTETDALVVGAGFAGLRALYSLREQGMSVVVLEASPDAGGVWYHNGYPGARCDVESFDYSYRFSPELEQEWRWSERYATQPEILRYVHHVVERFGLRKHIHFNSRLVVAEYDERNAVWNVTTEHGQHYRAKYLLTCVGQLSTTKRPDYPGQHEFRGQIIHSGIWPKYEVDLKDKRVAIIGTGSSGMQMTPIVAEVAKHLVVFQRSANFSVPAANARVTDEEDREVKANYRARRERARNSPTGLGFEVNRQRAIDASPQEREKVYEAAYPRLGFGFALAYHDILLNQASNDTAADFLRRKIGQKVNDPVIREKLTPRGHPFAARRPSVDGGYFEAFNRPNVELADVRESPIVEFTPDGIRTTAKLHEFDVVIFATGFDAFTGSLLRPEIIGRNGMTLREKWQDGPITQLGIAVHGFPNLFIVGGPGSPSLLSNVLLSTEEQVDWLLALICRLQADGVAEIEATGDAEQSWGQHLNDRAKETLYLSTNSFYNGAEVAGKPRVFMPYSGGVRGYRRTLEKVAADGYSGFVLRLAPLARAVEAKGAA
ncbi:MAG: NAD(P)/FAD-dependent oxidoreductase [Pseudomonadota bacterium]|nr:NAD(P)/FAD-dependent oxidoreductase [Pseudomonadota bacterium]